jgi:hypothetical protein
MLRHRSSDGRQRPRESDGGDEFGEPYGLLPRAVEEQQHRQPFEGTRNVRFIGSPRQHQHLSREGRTRLVPPAPPSKADRSRAVDRVPDARHASRAA